MISIWKSALAVLSNLFIFVIPDQRQKTVTQSFGVVLGKLEITGELENAVYNCCPDGLLSSSGGIVRLDIDREAPTMAMAMISAIDRLRKAGVPIVSIEMGGIPSGARISGPLVHQHELQTTHPS